MSNENDFVIKDGVLTKYLGKGADVVIPDGVTGIGDYVFGFCRDLHNVTIPDSVVSIGRNSFYESGIYSNWANWENGVFYIGKYLIAASGSLSGEYAVKPGTKVISDWAFSGCKKLRGICVPDTVISIGDSAFLGCSRLTSVVIPDSVTSISNSMFSGCKVLKNIVIPDSVTSIGDSAFFGCADIWDPIIPDGVTSIGNQAFSGCDSLQSIYVPESVTSIGDDAFSDCLMLQNVDVADSIRSIGENAFVNTGMYNDELNWENGAFYVGNVIVNAKESLLGRFIIKPGTKVIADSAFSNCIRLTGINIPDSVTSIGDSAFFGCRGLESVTIPDGVKRIGDGAFRGCSRLQKAVIPDSVTRKRKNAFKECSELKDVIASEKSFLLAWEILNTAQRTRTAYSCLKSGNLFQKVRQFVKNRSAGVLDIIMRSDDAGAMDVLISLYKKTDIAMIDSYLEKA